MLLCRCATSTQSTDQDHKIFALIGQRVNIDYKVGNCCGVEAATVLFLSVHGTDR